MEEPGRLFSPGRWCHSCDAAPVCGAKLISDACRDRQWPQSPGGEHVLHPADTDAWLRVADVGGLDFDDIVASPVILPSLPAYLPQVDSHFGRLRGQLEAPIYGVRIGQVWRSGGLMSAARLREKLELAPGQRIVLLLFDEDAVLEDVWSARMAYEIAEAAYSLVVAPSYSIWKPRPALEGLYNLRRSMVFFRGLQIAGAPAIPRVGWLTNRDVVRTADWVAQNSEVRMVGLDLQSYKVAADFREAVAGLATFDEATGRALRYVVNGATVLDRAALVLRAVEPERVHLTNATTSAQLRTNRRSVTPLLGLAKEQWFQSQAREREEVVADASRIARLGSRAA